MKLFVIAALIAVSSAGRLEHLEPSLRGYLPPSPGSSFGQGFGNHGANGGHGAHGAISAFGGHAAHGSQGAFGGHAGHGSHGGFGANSGSFGGSPAGRPGFTARASFGSPSNQYLPPNGFSASGSDDSVSVHGFGGQRSSNQQFGQGPSQFGNHGASSHGANHFGAQTRFGANSIGAQDRFGTNPFGAQSRFQPQSAVSRQYLAPHASQNIQQQPFDEQTGYQY